MGAVSVTSSFLRVVLENEREDDFAAFRHQDVVGATGGLAVHAFDADAARGEYTDQLGMDKALPCACAEDDDIGRSRADLREVIRGQVIERARWPCDGGDFGQHDEAAGKAYRIDLNSGLVVGGNSLVMLGGGGVELHDAIDTWMGVNFRQLEEKDGAL